MNDNVTTQRPTTVLRLRDVLERTKLSRTTIHVLVKQGEFPPPFKLTGQTNAWTDSSVQKWIEERARGKEKGQCAQSRITTPKSRSNAQTKRSSKSA